MCPKKVANREDEISMDDDFTAPEETALPKSEEDYKKFHTNFINNIQNIVADVAASADLDEDGGLVLIPDTIVQSLPPLGSTANKKPEEIKIPLKWKLGMSMTWYVYEYDGKDIVRAYYTDKPGMIIGSTDMSVTQWSELEFSIPADITAIYIERDLEWNPETTVAGLQADELFASADYVARHKRETEETIEKLKANAKPAEPQGSDDEDIF